MIELQTWQLLALVFLVLGLGVNAGVILMGCLNAGSDADDQMERMERDRL